MLTFISCAKTMASRCSLDVPEMTVPHFEAEAVRNVLEMSQMPVAELEKLLRVNARVRCVCPKKGECPCSIIGNRC